jgi:hypothetical protein
MSSAWRQAALGAGSNAVAAALAVFSRSTPADPMKVHDMLFAALRAKALYLRFIMIDHDLRIVVGNFLGSFLGRLHGWFSF